MTRMKEFTMTNKNGEKYKFRETEESTLIYAKGVNTSGPIDPDNAEGWGWTEATIYVLEKCGFNSDALA